MALSQWLKLMLAEIDSRREQLERAQADDASAACEAGARGEVSDRDAPGDPAARTVSSAAPHTRET